MRINKYIALATGLSRRAADLAISQKKVTINGELASLGTNTHDSDVVTLNGRVLKLPVQTQTILLNKPVGYVCSRRGQGSQTVYDLLPRELHQLKPVGRLDKDSSGLLVLTNDGALAEQLGHPRHQKLKKYTVVLDKPLALVHLQAITAGVKLVDGISALGLEERGQGGRHWQVTMHEGRNRQIRRTFEAVGYEVISLERTQFGDYRLGDLPTGQFMQYAAEQNQPGAHHA